MSVFDRRLSARALVERGGSSEDALRSPTEFEMKTALLLIDVQSSFTQRPYWSERDVPAFLRRTQQLIDRCEARGVPVLQVFHADEGGASEPFSRQSGHVRTLAGLRVQPAAVFYKNVHSALFARDEAGSTLDEWLRAHEIGRLIVTGIRTEQCCETTTRHASDLGYAVVYALDATLTFDMTAESGRSYSAQEIMERTALVLHKRFAEVAPAEAVAV